MTILDDLAASSRDRVAADRARRPLASIRAEAEELAAAERGDGVATFPFLRALAKPGLSFICEVKKASPSKGIIAPDFPYLTIARAYEAAGADAISVLTEPHWFLGSDEILQEIASTVTIPVLRKDFTVDEYQIYQAKTLGASAVLLICSILSDGALRDFRLLAEELGLSALVETHDGEEIGRAIGSGASILGVNNRNLSDFSVSFDNARNLRALVPKDVVFVAESGVRDANDVACVTAIGADAVLIGEALMRSGAISETLDAFKTAAAEAAPVATAQAPLRPTIKFCGLSQPDDVAAINEIAPDYVGFVFYPPSSRAVEPDEARALRAALDPAIATVGVFVDAANDFIADLAVEGVISVAQLHGHEDEAAIATLRRMAPGLEIWKAFLIKGPDDIAAANASSADLVMLDADLGGGRPFDWRWLDGIDRPFALAGGLTPDTVADAVARYTPQVVDVSSGIEASNRAEDGRTRKDPTLMRRFADAIRAKDEHREQR